MCNKAWPGSGAKICCYRFIAKILLSKCCADYEINKLKLTSKI